MDEMDGMDEHGLARTDTDWMNEVSQTSDFRFEKEENTLKCELRTMSGNSYWFIPAIALRACGGVECDDFAVCDVMTVTLWVTRGIMKD